MGTTKIYNEKTYLNQSRVDNIDFLVRDITEIKYEIISMASGIIVSQYVINKNFIDEFGAFTHLKEGIEITNF